MYRSLEKTISTLEMELAAARRGRKTSEKLQRVFAVVGINTGFSSRKRRDSLRQTWVPKGAIVLVLFEKLGMRLKKLEEKEKV